MVKPEGGRERRGGSRRKGQVDKLVKEEREMEGGSGSDNKRP